MDPKIYELAVQLRHELHQHPELSGEEFWTKARLIRFLK
ncbi:MAG TPA: amidohydrolase, partial [Bacillota bacterium]|nr:amidohydrolase [Bacillota bacterium]